MSDLPLPDGWVQQYDTHYKHPFWVDTKAKPPRATWVHPYEDEQFLAEHPEVKAKKEEQPSSNLDEPPSYDTVVGTQASGSSGKAGSSKRPDSPDITSGESSHTHPEHKRGVFGRLKDKAIGTKEEREEYRRIRAEQAAQAEERERQQRERARQERMRQLEEREAYMRAHGGYAPYHPSYTQPGSGPLGSGPGDNINPAALLLGGLAGGLLLGDIFGGGF